MYTTLDIDEDVLRAAREIARREKTTTGHVISELARKSLAARPARGKGAREQDGLRPFPRRGGIVTNELIDRLREAGAD